MKRIPKSLYVSADEVDQRILDRIAEADKLPAASDERQTILVEIAQLRHYANMKRWAGASGIKPGR